MQRYIFRLSFILPIWRQFLTFNVSLDLGAMLWTGSFLLPGVHSDGVCELPAVLHWKTGIHHSSTDWTYSGNLFFLKSL